MGLWSICIICRQKGRLSSVTCSFANLLRTERGRAFSCFSLGSLFLKAWNCHDRKMLSLLSSSYVGFCRPTNLKVCTTLEMAPLTVSSTCVPCFSSKNHPLLTAMANTPSMRICGSQWMPRSSSIIKCFSRNCSFTGKCCKGKQLISLGRGDITKCISICCGKFAILIIGCPYNADWNRQRREWKQSNYYFNRVSQLFTICWCLSVDMSIFSFFFVRWNGRQIDRSTVCRHVDISTDEILCPR